MPPRIRTRASKALKENIEFDNKSKNVKGNSKPSRKPLADKTNSASDDTSVEVPKKTKADVRSRRDRRMPNRFEENPVLVNLFNKSKENVSITSKTNSKASLKPVNTSTISVNDTPIKNCEPEPSSFKTPSKTETSLVVSRPRRICRLPSRFDDHSISPSKYIPIQPSNASTPKQNIVKPTNKENYSKATKSVSLKQTTIVSTRSTRIAVPEKKVPDKISPDTNNNAKARTSRAKKAQSKPSQPKKLSPKLNSDNSIRKFFNRTRSPQSSSVQKIIPKSTNGKKINTNNLSFKVFEGKKTSQESNKNDLDIYEFTFNPEEEPETQKKKRKKPVVKKPKVTKPKAIVTYKSTYDQNISKALSALKKVVKPSKTIEPATLPQIQETSEEVPQSVQENNIIVSNVSTVNNRKNAAMNDTGKTSVQECNYASIRVEDIAADIEPSVNHCDYINYSPVNSPRPENLAANPKLDPKQTPSTLNSDPLNLQEELSFFDDVPVASSSMNMSVRHPLASPWRVEFGSLPIKWHSNTYVKPNMTPAVESSFICSEDSNKKKHVYTNMLPETNDTLPQIVSNTCNLKQTSIISFIKEVAERQAKKKRGRSVSPTKATALFSNVVTNVPNAIAEEAFNTQNPSINLNASEEVSASSNDVSNDKENSKETRRIRKRKNNENSDTNTRPAKSPRKQQDKNCTYFGFDDSENLDQENVSPVKVKKNAKGTSLRPRYGAVLQEINGPTRAALPLAAKSKTDTNSEAINKVYEDLKSAADAPLFPENNLEANITNVAEPNFNDDSQSVHLFEDIEVVHHLKPTRKSYGKAKKVTFQRSSSDSDTEEAAPNINDTSFEDDLADLTFEVPNVKEKKKSKKKPKKLMSKKEEKEAEEWAAGFNSMCEEVEEFPLVVE